MVLDVVRKGVNLLLKTKVISLRLYWVQVCSYQRGFFFDQFILRGAVLLVRVSGELLRCCVFAPLGPSSVSGSGERLLMCVLALLGPSSASLYSNSDSVVLGSESGSRNVPCRGTVVSGARNVPCLDHAVVCLGSMTLLTQGQQGQVPFVSGEG